MTQNPQMDAGSIVYQQTMHKIALVAMCIEDEPFDAMLDTIQRAHAFGPIEYPTEYRRAAQSGSLDAQQRMLIAAKEFVASLAELQEKAP